MNSSWGVLAVLALVALAAFLLGQYKGYNAGWKAAFDLMDSLLSKEADDA